MAYSPTITYQVGSPLDSLREPYGPFIYKFSQADDHRIAGRPRVPWVASAAGTVAITGEVEKLGTSDEITIRIVKTGLGPPTTVFSQNLGAGAATLPIALQENISKNDTLSFEVLSDTPIDPGRVHWAPVVTYTTYCRLDPQTLVDVCGAVTCSASPGGKVGCQLQNDPVPDIPLPLSVIQQEPQVHAPLFQWLPATPTQTHVVGSGGTVSITGTVVKAPTPSPVVVLVQAVNRLLYKEILAANQAGAFDVNLSANVSVGEQLFFTLYSASDPNGSTGWAPAVDGDAAPVNVRFRDASFEQVDPSTSAPLDPMAGGFHRWFVGDWNGELPFNEASITFPDPTSAPSPFGLALPRRQGFPKLPMPVWVGRGADSFVAAGLIKPSRAGVSGAGRSDPGGGATLESLREGTTWNFEFSAGVSAGGVGINAAVNIGDTTSDLDLFDVNGDRYPDSVYVDGVRWNDGHGGFSSKQSVPSLGFDGELRRVEHRTIRGTISGKDIKLVNKTDSEGRTKGFLTTGFNVGLDYGMSATHIDVFDVNGDGLPDHVQQSPENGQVLVKLNLGYAFSSPIIWSAPLWQVQTLGFKQELLTGFSSAIGTDTLRLQDTGSNSVGVGVSGGGGSFGVSAGGGMTYSVARTFVELVDINGDGLPDQVMKLPNESSLRVKLNMGDHFAAEESWPIPGWPVGIDTSDYLFLGDIASGGSADALGFRRSKSYSGNVGGQVCYFVCVGASGFYSEGTGASHLGFDDIDGDGRLDHVLKLDGDSKVYARINQIGRANLLKAVHRPLGGDFTLEYEREGNRVELDGSACTTRLDGTTECGPVDMPSNQWALARVVTNDGMGNEYARSFEYRIDDPAFISQAGSFGSGFFDRVERESYGYAHVKTTLEDGATVDQHFHNQDFYRRGLLYRTVSRDSIERVFRVPEATYAAPSPMLEPLTGSFFPAELGQTTALHEGTTTDPNASVKTTHEMRGYDALGNLTSLFDAGDEGTDDDVFYTIGYQEDPVAYIFKPSSIVAKDGGGAVLRERIAHHRPDGAMDVLTNTLIGGINPATGTPYTGDAATNPTWHFDYDAFGNLRTVTDPKGFEIEYGYDALIKTHRTSVVDSFGYASSSVPNLRFGTVAEVTDVNGNKEAFGFDEFGRLSAVFGPYDIGASEPTILLEYGLEAGSQGAAPTWSRTRHKDTQHPGDRIDTVSFVDGLVRMIQTKKDLERDAGPTTQIGMTVGGALTFDVRGRVASRGQPTFDTGAPTSFVATPPKFPTTYQYDVLSRPTEIMTSDGASTHFEYGIEALDGVTRLQKKTTDPHGKVRRVLSSMRDETVAVIEQNTLGSVQKTLVTRYAYDPLNQLVTVTDAKGNATVSEHDTLGQRIALTSPDAGRTEYRYDPSGNLAAKQTAQLFAKGQLITYGYTYNRLEHIDYPGKDDVTYVYGAPLASDNRAGRISQVFDESGSEERFYGKLGETVRTVATLIGKTPGQPPVTATTEYQYDSFGRMLSMVYPDGETLAYAYDHGGLLASVAGTKAGQTYVYVERLTYDEFEQRARIRYGNGVETAYTYDPLMRRLTDLDTDSPASGQIQRLHYGYDLVGNITSLKNETPIPSANAYGGPTVQTFQYDDLYQLIGATGTYSFAPKKQRKYTLSIAYDEISNVVHKQQSDALIQSSGQGILQKPTTYNFTYAYGSSRPHAATHIGDRTYHFDASGNQTGWTHDTSAQQRTIIWNDDDQPASIVDNGQTTTFLYNAAGERTHKIGQQGETVYVNAFFTVRNNQIRTKHVFAGESRVASKIAQSSGNGTLPEDFLYFYHPDHLGSTSYVTDEDAEVFQHEEYFPFGETWVTEHANTERTPHLFNGKELDEELGLYYFGARYYDPRTNLWISADPALESFLGGAPAGGVYNPVNLGLYTYTWNNPVILRDPDGRAINFAAAGLGALAGAVIGGAAYAIMSDDITARGMVAAIAGGGVTGGLAGLTMGASLALEAGGMSAVGATALEMGATGSAFVAGGVTQRAIATGDAEVTLNPQAQLQDFAAGAATAGVAKVAGIVAPRVMAAAAPKAPAPGETARISLSKLESPKASITADSRYARVKQGVAAGKTPPIEVEPTGRGTYRIQEGVRRAVSARELKHPNIQAKVVSPTHGAPKTIPLKDVEIE